MTRPTGPDGDAWKLVCRRAGVVVLLLLARGVTFADPIASNTVVRFEIQRGTNALGVLDVELFDNEKPETVRNFLLYIRSGAYSNSFLHRCVPGFAVQGGGFSVTDPLGTNEFSTYREVTNYGRLTNEFLVGPRLSNTFGTIAMAKIGSDPNSATSQWFFNLGDNSANLDSQNGGFTVFGRVLESTNVNEGAAILNHFNTLSTGAGIVNLGDLLGSDYQAFSDLPVSYTNTTIRVPTDRELYFARISVLNRTNQPGQSPPTISLLSPAMNSFFTNRAVTVAGTATDDIEVARVVYRVQNGPLEIAAGTTNWQVNVAPLPGWNTVTVESIDWEGNRSTNAASVTFFYVVQVPLNLQVVGNGTVVGATNGQLLQVGRFYTVTAIPAIGSVFQMWNGSVLSTAPTLTFQVPTNATNFNLTANFITDPFIRLAGSYHGLFSATNSPTLENAGFLTLILRTDASFSGMILHRGGTYEYTGAFDRAGKASVQGILGGVNRFLSLQLNLTNTAGSITGSLLGGASSAEVGLERLASGLSATNAPAVGNYTFVVPPGDTSDPLAPGGDGFGTGTVNPDGALTLSGRLGDDTAFTASAMISEANRWPVYVTLFGGRGALLGWVSPSPNEPGNLDGSLQWIKPADVNWATYPAGFSNHVAFLASPYTPPTDGARVLNWVNGLATIAGADVVPGITNLVKLTTTNTISVVDSNAAGITLSLDLKTGLVSGSFVHPWVRTTNTLGGVILKRADSILGHFVDGNQTGGLNVSVTPFLVPQSIANITLPALTAALSDGGLLRFENNGVIVLTNSISIQFDTALDANGHDIVLSGGGTTRLFEVRSNVSFFANGITFANGRNAGTNGENATPPEPGGDGCGAGILNLGGIVGLTNCVLTNFSVFGGDAGVDTTTNLTPAPGGRGLGAAICNRNGRVTLQGCLLADNKAVGGRGSSVSGLFAASSGAASGGAMFSDGGDCQAQDSLFLRNQALGGEARLLTSGEYSQAGIAAGGALAITAGRLRLVSCKCLTNAAVGAGAPSINSGTGHGYGGVLFVDTAAEVVAEQVIFSGNSASGGGSEQTRGAGTGQGGAAFNAGSLELSDCTLEQNRALGGSSRPAGAGMGGALASVGAFVANACTFNDNLAQGGSYSETGTNSVAGAEATGGAIYALAGPVALTNSTFAFNRAVGGSGTDRPAGNAAARGNGRGGALTMVSNSAVLINLTLAFNEAAPGPLGDTNTGRAFGGGIAILNGAVTLRNSILASNAPGNFFGGVADNGYNLSSDGSFILTATGSRVTIDALLGVLTTNGGPTRTMAILADSPARDAILSNYPSVDQRGIARPQGLRGDIGAFEFVQTLPTFVVQPMSANVQAGTDFTFQALATGSGPISYFWIKDGALLSGATNAALLLANIQEADAGNYAAIATNSFGAVTSTVATLTVDSRPLILTEPNDVIATPGGSASFVVDAGGPALNYSWLHNNMPVPDGTNAVLTISDAAPGAQGSYQVIITNFTGSVTSRLASLTFDSRALSILSPPQSVIVAEGDSASFNVLVSGVAPIGYQWEFERIALPNATNSVLTLPNVNTTNAGAYRVVVTNAYLTLTSAPAPLTVIVGPALSIAAQDTNILITCRGVPGRLHRLLRATNLGPGAVWTDVATNTLPGSGSFVWTQPVPTNGSVYYRAATP